MHPPQPSRHDERRSFTASDGARLVYWLERAGGDCERALLLIHGAASNHTRWNELSQKTSLAADWDLLRPDMRGVGESTHRGRLDLAVWCRDLEELLDDAGYRQATVVGHSLGAQVALHFAYRAPQRVAGLALIDPIFPAALSGRPRRIAQARPLLKVAAWLGRGLNALGLHRGRLPHQDLEQLDRDTRKALEESDAAEIARRYGSLRLILTHTPSVAYLQHLLATVAPLPPLEQLDLPILVLISGGVSFADPAVGRREIARLPRVEVVEIDADHWPLTETPDATREAIERWVRATFGRDATAG